MFLAVSTIGLRWAPQGISECAKSETLILENSPVGLSVLV